MYCITKKNHCNFKVQQMLGPKSQIEIRLQLYSNKQNWIEIFDSYLTTNIIFILSAIK